jgi:hypothetical protein
MQMEKEGDMQMEDERIRNDISLHDEEKPELCPFINGVRVHALWRVVLCDSKNDTDIVECSRCGQQKRVRCNFDDDYA